MYSLQRDDSPCLQEELRSAMQAFNQAHFDTQRIPLGFKFVDENQQLVAGITAQVFGNWLMISWLWCAETARGHGLATQLLHTIEEHGQQLGAKWAQLDTLDFQAKPFYEKNGYVVKYQLNNYPLSGTRYFMEKEL
ncbi:GNAT family N-acetyltransferase [Pseudoalteromonas haloplanktis]|uniref:GNAT family N-acetyltransferase n=1 Tax=Pseudoalteromonas haloplanktis TaxID=228 RepID=A0ABU1BCL7_PSEHA|nr:GNAT family N-acetyltransferase [Pseudoalteromonas haloplanktis]MDQ9092223.1 GNAT family N-acetyltransferase [Pseudoalteromonas haloplanktis]